MLCLAFASSSAPSHFGGSIVFRFTKFLIAAATSSSTRPIWITLPSVLGSEESPIEVLTPKRVASPFATTTPTVTPIAAPATNASDILTARSSVTKMIADMIWGPAIIVMASGTMSVLTAGTYTSGPTGTMSAMADDYRIAVEFRGRGQHPSLRAHSCASASSRRSCGSSSATA